VGVLSRGASSAGPFMLRSIGWRTDRSDGHGIARLRSAIESRRGGIILRCGAAEYK